MADEKRQPMAVEVNGAYLFVKDPSPSSGDLFTNYQRVTGLSSFTLPAEVGGANEIQLMDGTVQFASRKGVGTITGALGSLDSHVAQRFLEDASLSGDTVQVAIVRLAEPVGDIEIAGVTTDRPNLVDMGRAQAFALPVYQGKIKNLVLAGHLFGIEGAVHATDVKPVQPTSASVAGYRATAVSADDALWQSVVSVEDDGARIIIAPGYSADITLTNGEFRSIFFRRPGAMWADISVKVSGFDAGDFQQGSAVASNITLTPSGPVPAKTPEHRLTLAQSATDGSYTV